MKEQYFEGQFFRVEGGTAAMWTGTTLDKLKQRPDFDEKMLARVRHSEDYVAIYFDELNLFHGGDEE